ncbi:RING finger protein 112-like [Emydura macquarii macquarii]|uniref:RING finger protein 112-like n=1 Tax=Emydura macquarii macquarii TaxID=1129001 RepID=UPI00352A2A5B
MDAFTTLVRPLEFFLPPKVLAPRRRKHYINDSSEEDSSLSQPLFDTPEPKTRVPNKPDGLTLFVPTESLPGQAKGRNESQVTTNNVASDSVDESGLSCFCSTPIQINEEDDSEDDAYMEFKRSLGMEQTEPRREHKKATRAIGPAVQPEPGRPVQLVRLDEEGDLFLDEEALSRCLEQGEVGAAPVCLVSIVGEQRRGKSFLMNYLLRRLQSLEASEGSWMGWEDEPLEGFEWRMDIQRVTEGVWAWSQPFWVLAEGGKVAVLLIDTKGSMDIESNKETSIKLSALSMLLSSYQILNIGSRVKDTDLEYLEMFLHVAEVVGEAYGLEPIQHLDLLVRDWSSSRILGADGGKEYLRNVRQMLAATSPCKHPKALEALKRSSTHCYLMPFPGKGIMTGNEGRLRDMDEDFRESLRGYVTSLVGSVGQHVRRDQHGEPLNRTQLAAMIKNLSDVMKESRFGFSSPCQMAITFHNQRAMDRVRMDHTAFLREKDGDSQNIIACLKVRPSKMAEQFAEQRKQLLWQCQTDMRELALEKEALLTELEAKMMREDEKFLETYGKRFKKLAIGAGVGVGALALASVGGVVGAGIAVGAVAAVVTVGLTGAGVGVAAGIGIGGSMGWGFSWIFAKKDIKRVKDAGSQREEKEEGTEDPSDKKPLI